LKPSKDDELFAFELLEELGVPSFIIMPDYFIKIDVNKASNKQIKKPMYPILGEGQSLLDQ
jgi:hypothetical protein